MGRIAAIKMVILPTFLFVFQNLIVKFDIRLLQQIQKAINNFIWNRKKPRIKISTFQQGTRRGGGGGVAVPNVKLYYQAAHLAAMVQWWNPRNTAVWLEEQITIPVLLTDWILLAPIE